MDGAEDGVDQTAARSVEGALLRQALDALRDVLLVTDADLRFTYVSRSVRDVLGYEVDQLLGRSPFDLLPVDDHDAARRLIEARFAGRVGTTITHRSLHADGRLRYLETMIDVLVDDGAFRGAVFSSRDVTGRIEERQRLEREVAFRGALVEVTNELLAASLDERFYQHALERTIALVPDAQGGSMLLLRDDDSFGFEAAVEFDLDVLRSITLTGTELGRCDPPRVERLAVREYDGRLSDATYRRFASAGRLDDIQVTLSVPMLVAGRVHGYLNLDNFERAEAFDDGDVAIAEAIAAQVSVALQRRLLEHDLQAERARYEQMASHDALTELPNRRLFQDRLQQALARARRRDRRVGVLFIDLDGFKQVNDRHGHDAGDAVLKAIGTLLANGIRAEDTVARLGGDEFGVLLADVNDAEDAASVGGKLLAALSTPVAVGGTEVRLGASVGVAVFPDHGIDPDAVMRAADDAMYRVKDDGKDGVCVADDEAGDGQRRERST
jgi:diguanylate cyclase (GGDEF)-like protein/PAS domain S-box-containing protein